MAVDKVALPFALSLQRTAFARFLQRFTGAHVSCSPGVTPRSKSQLPTIVFSPFLQAWSEFFPVPERESLSVYLCVNSPSLPMVQVVHHPVRFVHHKLHQLLLFTFGSGLKVLCCI